MIYSFIFKNITFWQLCPHQLDSLEPGEILPLQVFSEILTVYHRLYDKEEQ